jgi:hypothetical protein
MKHQMKLFISALMLLPLAGCVTDSNVTQFKKVKPKQRVYMGRVDITLNGQKAEKCELFMNSQMMSNLKVAADGYIVYRTSDREPYLGKVRCLHRANNRKSAWHTQSLNLKKLERPKKRKSVNYFGHLSIKWDIDPAKTLSAQARDPYAFKQVGMVNNSGEIQLSVADNTKEATDYLKTNWKALNDFRVETHLVVNADADEDEELER